MQVTEVINILPPCMIYQKIQKNEQNPNMKKAKGLALFLAHDLEKGWMSKFQTFFLMTYYIPLDSSE